MVSDVVYRPRRNAKGERRHGSYGNDRESPIGRLSAERHIKCGQRPRLRPATVTTDGGHFHRSQSPAFSRFRVPKIFGVNRLIDQRHRPEPGACDGMDAGLHRRSDRHERTID